MIRKLHVGNLSDDTGNADLERLFSQFGTVRSAQVVTRRLTGRSQGFGYVEMDSDEEAHAAMTALDGQELGGNRITVSPARPVAERFETGSRMYQGDSGGRRR